MDCPALVLVTVIRFDLANSVRSHLHFFARQCSHAIGLRALESSERDTDTGGSAILAISTQLVNADGRERNMVIVWHFLWLVDVSRVQPGPTRPTNLVDARPSSCSKL